LSEQHHIAIATSLTLLVGWGAGRLHVSKIAGQYSQTLEKYQIDETMFSVTKRALREFKTVAWGKLNLPFEKTVFLKDIHKVEGEVILSELAVQIPRTEKIVRDGVPELIQASPVLFYFTKWPFKPSFCDKIFNRRASGKFYEFLKKQREKYTNDKEITKRLRDTLLVNKPPRENVTLNEYKLWFGEFALILPESIGDFKGRELSV